MDRGRLREEGTGPVSAELRPTEEARGALRAGATKALQNRDRWRALYLQSPITATVHATAPASLERLAGISGIAYKDNGVTFTVSDQDEALRGVRNLADLAATLGYYSVLLKMLAAEPGGIQVFDRFNEAVAKQWMETETANWRR